MGVLRHGLDDQEIMEELFFFVFFFKSPFKVRHYLDTLYHFITSVVSPTLYFLGKCVEKS